jgi:predicted O-linked N-acetylglucosamine transferase (SPINDLY family)
MALTHLLRAARYTPDSPDVLVTLGDFHFKRRNMRDALPCFLKVAQAEPGSATAWRNVAVTYSALGHHEQALDAYLRAIERAPQYINAYHGAALALTALDRHMDAIPFFQQVITLDPKDHEALFNFGNALVKIGETNAAEAAFQVSIGLKPDFAQACCNLGQLYFSRGQTKLALTYMDRAIAIDPQFVEGHNNRGAILQREGLLGDALTAYRQAALLRPDFAEAHGNIGAVELAFGNLAAARTAYERSLALKPDNAAVFSDMLFSMQNDASLSIDTIFAAHRRYAAQFETPQRARWPSHTNPPDPDRKLRVGYVSGDLRHHAVAFFIEPILAAHDRERVELFAYANHAQVDAVTQRLSRHFDQWVPCAHLSDDALAERIRADGIDILIDLSGHTAYNRLPVFARKPAPVQATWIGYGGSTGLDAVEYRITDAWLDPVGDTERFHSEKLVRLPTGNVAFQFIGDAPPVSPLPALSGKPVRLACLNNPRKIGPRVIALWSRILAAAPTATLLLGNASDPALQTHLRAQFSQNGIDAARIDFQAWMPIHDYLALHRDIDLALDPFPFNGGTTSFHSLWMGVPFVSLAGDRTLARCGAAILAMAGLDDFVVTNEDDYYRRTLAAIGDPVGLDRIRQSLRPRLADDARDRPQRVAQALEAAMRDMWRRWCEQT